MISMSMICATIDTAEKVNEMIYSIEKALHKIDNKFSIELIIVDQNKLPIAPLLITTKRVKTTYIHSKKTGLSINRNLGIKIIKSTWVMFIDADCQLDLNFLFRLHESIIKHPGASVFIGQILSIESCSPILRNWPRKELNINTLNVWRLATSVNCVYKSNCIGMFDEKLGIGSIFGSCEDVDFALASHGKKLYNPKMITLHPFQELKSNNISKIESYSRGFGALCKKRAYQFGFSLLIISIIKKIIELLTKKINTTIFTASIKARVSGFYHFK